MLKFPHEYFWLKFGDINREYATFEFRSKEDEGYALLLDVGFTDDGVFEIAFQEAFTLGWTIEWDSLKDIIEEGRQFAEADK